MALLILKKPATTEQIGQMGEAFSGTMITDINALRKRYETLAWPQQLGNLASTLARVSARSTSSQDDALTVNLLREAALLLEWSAPQTPPTFWLELAAMQRELLAWQRVWPIDSARSLLALHTRHQSDRLLQMAGLVG